MNLSQLFHSATWRVSARGSTQPFLTYVGAPDLVGICYIPLQQHLVLSGLPRTRPPRSLLAARGPELTLILINSPIESTAS